MHIALLMRAGPHCFNDRLTAALRADGHTIDPIAVASHDDARRALDLADTAQLVIDGDALPFFDSLAIGHATALLHHAGVPHDTLRRVKQIIATDAVTADSLTKLDPIRTTLVTPGADALPRSTGSASGCAILAVGPLIPAQKHDLLLRALARLFDLEWSLTIIGSQHADPDHAKSLADLATGIGTINFAGDFDEAATATLWQNADLFVSASGRATPATMSEALVRGVPAIVTGDGEPGTLMPLHAGLVCPPDDRDQLSRALRRLIFDPALRRSYADAAFAGGRLLPSWESRAKLVAGLLT